MKRLMSILCILIMPILLRSQTIQLPSNPLEGRIVFEAKGCIDCHAISGFGGTIGPDLSKQRYYGSFLELAAIIWNHIPKMNRQFRKLKKERPSFSEQEMLDLIGFLYYLRYLGEPGSVQNGRKLLKSKGCLNCHSLNGRGGEAAPDFVDLGPFGSPLYLVQAMWNHGPQMQAEMRRQKMSYPKLEGKDIVDISAFLRAAVPATKNQLRMSPGDPQAGARVFKEKKCIVCHELKRSQTGAPQLKGINLRRSVTEIAGLMWNHSPNMIRFMKKNKLEFPEFKGKEMADLIAYLYFLGFEDPPGDPKQGEKVFEEKGCASCHQEGGQGPLLKNVARFESPIKTIQLMWNHAPQMEDLLLMQNREWPKLSTQEMRDLYAYLKETTGNN